MSKLHLSLLKSLFGQFKKDVVFYVPMSFATMLVVMVGFKSFPVQKTLLGSSRHWMLHKMVFKFFKNFVFRDADISFRPWMLFLYSLSVTLMTMKVMGLLPYGFTLTSHASFTYSLAFPLWGAMQMFGFMYFFKSRVAHFLPTGTPWPLVPLMMMMEIVGLFMQPVALGLRLAANMTAGHVLIYLFSVAIWVLSSSSMIASFMFFVVLFLLFLLEMGVALMQSYVFVALLCFFYSQKVEH